MPRAAVRNALVRVSAKLIARWMRNPGCRQICQDYGFHPSPLDYMSTIPDVRHLVGNDGPPRTFDSSSLGLDCDAQLDRLAALVERFGAEAMFPEGPDESGVRFHLGQDKFTRGDARVLYMLLRELGPATVMEVGSGNSSLLIGQAAARNASEGRGLRHVVVDPHAGTSGPCPPATAEIVRRPVQSVSTQEFAALAAGDVLFVDSSHVVKFESDVLFLLLDVLPSLKKGVVVHFHDIYLPYEYPSNWLRDHYFYNESYFVHALLSGNETFEILLAHHYLDRSAPSRIRSLLGDVNGPTSLWLRKRA